LNAPEPAGNGENGVEDQNTVDSPEDTSPQQHLPPQQPRTAMPQQHAQMNPNYMAASMDQQQQAMAYQNYVQQQQRGGGYAMPPQTGMPQQHSHQA
jgi:pheromone receptor transcription factor